MASQVPRQAVLDQQPSQAPGGARRRRALRSGRGPPAASACPGGAAVCGSSADIRAAEVSADAQCVLARVELGAHLLGAIEPAQRALVDRHLAACPRCRAELAGLAGLPTLLRRAGPFVSESGCVFLNPHKFALYGWSKVGRDEPAAQPIPSPLAPGRPGHGRPTSISTARSGAGLLSWSVATRSAQRRVQPAPANIWVTAVITIRVHCRPQGGAQQDHRPSQRLPGCRLCGCIWIGIPRSVWTEPGARGAGGSCAWDGGTDAYSADCKRLQQHDPAGARRAG